MDERLEFVARLVDGEKMAADSIAGYIQGPLDGVAFMHTAYALDRDSRKSALAHFLGQTNPADRQAGHVV